MQCFTLSTEDHVAHLVLSRPEALNTMHPTFWRELDDTLTRLHREGKVRALVISSTGKHFSAGMALDTFGGAITMDDTTPEGRAAIFDLLTEMQGTFTKLETLRCPVIAAIQGGCIGGAVDMVTACCIRYATADAFFCIQEINIGMVADVGTCSACPSWSRWAWSRNWPTPGAAWARRRRWVTVWSTKCLTPRTPWWPPRCNAPARLPPNRRWPSGAPSR
jgi:enoyl-CoA hydratase